MAAVSPIFSDSKVMLCDLHRGQACGKWLQINENGVEKLECSRLAMQIHVRSMNKLALHSAESKF